MQRQSGVMLALLVAILLALIFNLLVTLTPQKQKEIEIIKEPEVIHLHVSINLPNSSQNLLVNKSVQLNQSTNETLEINIPLNNQTGEKAYGEKSHSSSKSDQTLTPTPTPKPTPAPIPAPEFPPPAVPALTVLTILLMRRVRR